MATPGALTNPIVYREDYLARAPLFEDLDERALERLATYCEERRYFEGQYIVRQGDSDTLRLGLYIITSGRVAIVHTNEEGQRRELAVLGPGDSFGEMSVIDGAPRSASAIALVPTQCLCLSALDFRQAMKDSPAIALNLLRVLCQRLRQANQEGDSGLSE